MRHQPPLRANLFQSFTTLIVKYFFHTSNLKQPSFSLEHLSCCCKPNICSAICPYLYYKLTLDAARSSWQLRQAEHPQLSQPEMIGEVLQPSEHPGGLLCTHSNRSISILCWGCQSWTQNILDKCTNNYCWWQHPHIQLVQFSFTYIGTWYRLDLCK